MYFTLIMNRFFLYWKQQKNGGMCIMMVGEAHSLLSSTGCRRKDLAVFRWFLWLRALYKLWFAKLWPDYFVVVSVECREWSEQRADMLTPRFYFEVLYIEKQIDNIKYGCKTSERQFLKVVADWNGLRKV